MKYKVKIVSVVYGDGTEKHTPMVFRQSQIGKVHKTEWLRFCGMYPKSMDDTSFNPDAVVEYDNYDDAKAFISTWVKYMKKKKIVKREEEHLEVEV